MPQETGILIACVVQVGTGNLHETQWMGQRSGTVLFIRGLQKRYGYSMYKTRLSPK
jgi:hypothetical protein